MMSSSVLTCGETVPRDNQPISPQDVSDKRAVIDIPCVVLKNLVVSLVHEPFPRGLVARVLAVAYDRPGVVVEHGAATKRAQPELVILSRQVLPELADSVEQASPDHRRRSGQITPVELRAPQRRSL